MLIVRGQRNTPAEPQGRREERSDVDLLTVHAGKHALIIEDHDLSAEVMETLLGKYGLTATVMETPRGLEDVLESIEKLDIIFLDLEFRESNGFEAQSKLGRHPRTANIPVVAYTVHISQMERAREAGFHSFMGKPIEQEDFGEHLNRILNGEQVWVI